MGYLVLARKWRPQAFEDVTGQAHVVRTLANAIAQGRVAHALLLCGPRGVGKTTTARLLARALNCDEGPTATPCGNCLPCKEIAAGTSVDVVEIDGASNNGVENVREIRDTVRYLPQRDRHKIFIIDEVHMLSVAAFNALLKTLEEPPSHVKFIFATTDPQKLPDTILSRCQRHNFKQVSASQMVERLRTICDAEGIEVSDRVLGLIARQADGGMRDALSLLDQLISSVGLSIEDAAAEEALGLIDRTLVFAMSEALLARDGKAVVELVARIYERGFDAKRFCEELAEHLRDLLYVQAIGQVPDGTSDLEAKALQERAAGADPAQLTRLFHLVHGALRDLSFAARPRLALEVALLSAVHLAPGQGLSELVARVESLAAGGTLPAGGVPPRGGGGGAVAPGPTAPAAPRAAPPAGHRHPPAPPRQSAPTGEDLVARLEAMARGGQGAPRAQRQRPARESGPSDGDDEGHPGAAPARFSAGIDARPSRPPPAPAPARPAPPPAVAWEHEEPPPPGDDDFPAGFEEGPARLFPPEAPPGGCASGACGPEDEMRPAAAPAAPGALPAGDDPTRSPQERWRAALEWMRGEHPLAFNLLAEGRLAWIRPGEVALGYAAGQSFHREQLAAPEIRERAEALLSRWFGRETRLRLDEATVDAPASVAEESRARRSERARRLREEAREHPAVLAAQAILGAEIEEIQILEDHRTD